MVRFSVACRLGLSLMLGAAVLTGCSRDPNVRKQKYFQSGQHYFLEGKYREAAIEFSNAVKTDQNYADARYHLALSYLKLQKWSSAYQELSRTVELQPENYSARIDLAKLLISTGNLQAAREQTDLLLQKQPNNPQAHFVAASLLAAQMSFPAAIVEMQKAIALDPSDWDLYLNLALMQMKNNQTDAAEANFKKAVELNPKAFTPWLMLGTYYQSRGRYDEAEQELRRAIELQRTSLDPRAALARLYLAGHKNAEAEELLTQVKHDFPDDSVGYRMLGDFYFRIGDIGKALAEYGALYSAHPHDLEVKKNYVQLLIMSHRLDEARRVDDEVLKASPNDNVALIYRGQLQGLTGDPNGALETLQTATKNDSKDAAAHYHLGEIFEKLGNLESAESEWREAVRLRPDLIEAQRALALLAMRKGDMITLEQAAAQIINLRPELPDGYALRSISYINRKQFGAAQEDIRKAIEVGPHSQLGYVQLGNLKFVQRQYTDAAQAYQEALDRDPNSTDALRGLMNTYLVQNQVDKALAAAAVQIIKVPNNSSFYDLRGTVLFRNKRDLNGAEADFNKSLELDRNNSDALIKLGQDHAAKGEIDKAVATYQQAIKDHPRAPEFYNLIGALYESKRNWNDARNAYQKALDLKSNDPIASLRLAKILLQSGGDVDAALSLAQAAHRSMPDSPDAADTLGFVYYQKGAYPLALSLFEQALKLQQTNHAPDNPDVHYHLGLAYQKTEQPALARQQLERALQINPNYSAAAEIKKQLGSLKS